MEVPTTLIENSPPGTSGGAARVHVRSLRMWDWKSVRVLLLSTFRDLDPGWLAEELRSASHRFAVATVEGRLVGAVRMDIQPQTHHATLDLLAVDTQGQDHGVATALLHYVDEVCVACGVRHMSLSAPTTLAFLTRLGFRVSTAMAGRSRPASARAEAAEVCWTRRAESPPLPDWRLRDKHAPRVPMGPMLRTARAALYSAWVGGPDLGPSS